jgi:hypothetical protein
MRLVNKVLGIVIAAAFTLNVNATVWRVNNNTSVDADFTSVSAAYSAASPGDTLYIEGSGTNYSTSININKKIIMIGPGFHLDKNDSTQANQNDATLTGYIRIQPGAEGSEFHGLNFEWSSYFNGCYSRVMIEVDCDSISFIRNRMYWTYSGSSSAYTMFNICDNHQDITLIGNWMVSQFNNNNCMRVGSACTSILIANNFIAQSRNSSTDPMNYNNSYYAIRTQNNPNNRITFLNNVIQGRWQSYYCTNLNNIHIVGSIDRSQSTWYNNIGHNTSIPSGNGNQLSVNYTTIFERTTNGAANWWEDENYWRLIAAGPAEGAGVSGEDCGFFGGALQFNPSGLPAIPAIFNATIPATTDKGSGLSIDISSKSHK